MCFVWMRCSPHRGDQRRMLMMSLVMQRWWLINQFTVYCNILLYGSNVLPCFCTFFLLMIVVTAGGMGSSGLFCLSARMYSSSKIVELECWIQKLQAHIHLAEMVCYVSSVRVCTTIFWGQICTWKSAKIRAKPPFGNVLICKKH